MFNRVSTQMAPPYILSTNVQVARLSSGTNYTLWPQRLIQLRWVSEQVLYGQCTGLSFLSRIWVCDTILRQLPAKGCSLLLSRRPESACSSFRPNRYRIAGNFREHQSPTNTPGKKFRDFYFRDKVTISDHTPHNFPHGNGDLQRVFQRQNDSKTLACLSKRVGRCRRRTAMPKGGS